MDSEKDSPGGVGVLERELQELIENESTDDGDHDRFSHYVDKDDLTEAMVNGWPVIALCGKVWVPSRDPDRYQVCPTCKEVYEEIGS